MMRMKSVAIVACLMFAFMVGEAQTNVIDKVVAVVGGNIILKSDVEERFLEMQAQGQLSGDVDNARCDIFEGLLVEKLLLAEAEIDTLVEVSDSQVSNELGATIESYYDYLGSKKAVEKYFKKPIHKIKSDMRVMLRDRNMTSQKQALITQDVTITPAEVRQYYRKIAKEDLPDIPAQLEYSHILLKPKVSEKEVLKVKTQLRTLKKRIAEGASFASFAVMYSEGPSSKDGGDLLKYSGKSSLDAAFAEAAFALKPGEVSGVVESEFGFHIIQLIDKKENKIRCRHIILKPKVDSEEQERAGAVMDSIKVKVDSGDLAWDRAAYFYSSDKDTRNNGGLVLNPQTMSTKFGYDQVDKDVLNLADNLKEGEISDVYWTTDRKDIGVFKMIKINRKVKKHKAEIGEDYQLLADICLANKKEAKFSKWLEEQSAKTYIKIDDSYKDCNFKFSWF